MTTTTAPKYDTIDKVMVTLLSAKDSTGIVAAHSAVLRKLDASKLNFHNLVLRPPQDGMTVKDAYTQSLLNQLGEQAGTLREQTKEIERLKEIADDPDITKIVADAIKFDRRKAFAEYAALEAETIKLDERVKGAEAWTQTLTERAEAAEAKLKLAEDRAEETRKEMAIVSYRAEELTIRAESAEEKAEEYRKFGESLRALIATLGDVVK